MSVFGGDSWAREAQFRKRRVDDLLTETLDDSSIKKLSNGKFACLLCSHNPILDTPLMLSIHRKGSRHQASESKLKEKQLMKQEEISKRVALSGSSSTCRSNPNSHAKESKSSDKPLVKNTRKIASAAAFNRAPLERSKEEEPNVGLNTCNLPSFNFSQTNSLVAAEAFDGNCPMPQFDFRERRERELKFTAAGWKRDGHGKWYKDENVEFDSDEEDPNICLG